MTRPRLLFKTCLILPCLAASTTLVLAEPATRPTTRPDYPPTTPNVGHERHLHPHNHPHERAPDPSRFHTSRPDAIQLPLPNEEDAFMFAVFGDRTGGPDDGVRVLADAVRDVNLLEPDLVMTVGDLVQGYNERPEWMRQMREYKGIMNQLISPWFPVAGNHDIYWRDKDKSGDTKPVGEHESEYEMHFGPLWYAFEHKNSWFIVLYSDEGVPATGVKNFNLPASHIMSPEQKTWLGETLEKASDAEHVFLFLHHPRWTGGQYGDSWDEVHEMLVDAGNVTAVFAGHIHRMRYDGPKDGIEYVTLATTGGGNGMAVPEAGMLHHYHLITVRKDQVAMAAFPVGAAMDVREITPELAADAESLATLKVDVKPAVELGSDGSVSETLTATFNNPARRAIDVELIPASADSRWRFTPDHDHFHLEAGEAATFKFHVARMPDSLDEAFRPLELKVRIDLLGDSTRYKIPERLVAVNVRPPRDWRPTSEQDKVLALDGNTGAVRVESAAVPLPEEGSVTLEAWFNGDDFAGRRGLVCKTESSDYGIFVNNGQPEFSIFLGNRYVTAGADEPILEPGRWYHIAGVYDGDEVRLYVDGELVDHAHGTGQRRTNDLPLYIGADVNRGGNATSHFDGKIDAVRLSNVARYTGESFEPSRDFAGDDETLLLLDMDAALGPWLFDAGPKRVTATMEGDAKLAADAQR